MRQQAVSAQISRNAETKWAPDQPARAGVDWTCRPFCARQDRQVPGQWGSRDAREGAALLDSEGRVVAFLVLIYAPAEQRDITTEVLLEIYGLTRSQAELLHALALGPQTF